MTAEKLIYVPSQSRSGESGKRSAAFMVLTHRVLQAYPPCTPPRHSWHLPAARLCQPCTPRGTVAMLAAPASAGVTPPVAELLFLPGATRSAGPCRHLCTQRLQVGAGTGPRACKGLRPVPAEERERGNRVPQREFGAGEGTPCPGARQSRAEAPWALCHPRPACWEDKQAFASRAATPVHRAERFPLIQVRVPPAAPRRAGAPLPRVAMTHR